MTMIDPATGWFEVHEIPNKRSDKVANVINQEWFHRHPWSTQVICDRGKKSIAKEFQEMAKKLQDEKEANHHQKSPGKCHSGKSPPNLGKHGQNLSAPVMLSQ